MDMFDQGTIRFDLEYRRYEKHSVGRSLANPVPTLLSPHVCGDACFALQHVLFPYALLPWMMHDAPTNGAISLRSPTLTVEALWTSCSRH